MDIHGDQADEQHHDSRRQQRAATAISRHAADYDLALHALIVFAGLLSVGVSAALPFGFSWVSVRQVVSPLQETWWRLALFAAVLVTLAGTIQLRTPRVAGVLGSLGVMAILFPCLSFIAVFPQPIGWAGIPIVIGALGTWTSVAVLVASRGLQFAAVRRQS